MTTNKALHVEAAKGNIQYVRERFPSCDRFEKNYALFFAVKYNQIEVAEFLIDNKVKPNAHGVLLVAASRGNYEMFKFLVNKGADVSEHDHKAFFHAVRGRHDHIVKEILKSDASLTWAIKRYIDKGDMGSVRYLVKMGMDTSGIDLSKIFL